MGAPLVVNLDLIESTIYENRRRVYPHLHRRNQTQRLADRLRGMQHLLRYNAGDTPAGQCRSLNDATGGFCTSEGEREFTLGGSWYAFEKAQR